MRLVVLSAASLLEALWAESESFGHFALRRATFVFTPHAVSLHVQVVVSQKRGTPI